MSKSFNSNLINDWIFERSWCASGSHYLDIFKKNVRFINFISNSFIYKKIVLK
jgi:hypothetical protein